MRFPTPRYCPECGQFLADVDVAAHAENHWPANIDPRQVSPEAARRKAVLLGQRPDDGGE